MSISLPTKIDIKNGKNNKAQIIIEPCYPGYGVTLGNSLRRVLLSSIEGTAITAFKIKGVQHEFSHLPNIKEDAIEIMLNLKSIRLKSYSSEPLILNLKVKGEKLVTAKDIEKNAQVEIINGDQPICTMTDKNTELEMELTVAKGHGYVTVEEREKEKVDLGTIMIDAIYTPVINVGFDIENVRVGERTDYERLILNIETDGSLPPEDALQRASTILVRQFLFVSGEQSVENQSAEPEAELKDGVEDSAVSIKQATVAEAAVEQKGSSAKAEPATKKRGRPKKNDK